MAKKGINSLLKRKQTATTATTAQRREAANSIDDQEDSLERFPEVAESDDKLADLLSRIDRLAGYAADDDMDVEEDDATLMTDHAAADDADDDDEDVEYDEDYDEEQRAQLDDPTFADDLDDDDLVDDIDDEVLVGEVLDDDDLDDEVLDDDELDDDLDAGLSDDDLLDASEEPLAGTASAKDQMTTAPHVDNESSPKPPVAESNAEEFFPPEPSSLREAGLTESEVEQLILKSLLGRGESSGRDLADQLKLPFVLIDELLRRMKYDQLLVYRDSAPMNDYIYEMTDVGRERARRFSESCSYYGAAPVAMDDYIRSVKAQSLETQHPTVDELRAAFSDLLINDKMLERLGPAINSGRGLFLFGAPGNGKTSIAERVTSAFGNTIWIPRAIGVDGEVMRLFDPVNHEEVPLADSTGLLIQDRVDRRWIRIKRPTIVVGGELTMDALEVTMNRSTGISEAPIQMKSNCGTLVIDDFGRQRMTTDELLNRWIVPLEKRYDFLNLSNGKKLQVPFDQLIIFSTNLEPKDLVDEAFLRRIPYKIEVVDPSEEDFRGLFKIMCPMLGFEFNQDAIDHLIAEHYTKVDRPFRNCQPRDLLLQVRNHCFYRNLELDLKPSYFDMAAENYFAVV